MIVNTASVAAFDGQIGQGAYASSKGGVVALTLPAARELARFCDPCRDHCARAVRNADAGRPSRSGQGIADRFHAAPGAPGALRGIRVALVRHIYENPMINGETIRLDGTVRLAPR